MITVDTWELDKLISLFEWRADNLVPQAAAEGERRARSYAWAGGREVRRRRGGAFGGRRRRVQVTAAKIASMQEKVLYRRFVWFFERPDRDW
jgi:hypothetical protein